MFAPADSYSFILFTNVTGVWPSYAAIVISESPVATLLLILVPVALCVDGLFILYPHPDDCLLCLYLLMIHCLFRLHPPMIHCDRVQDSHEEQEF